MFESFFTSILALIPLLGILVFVHELGHFLTAKLFGVRVERFSIGFPPRLFGYQLGDTDYCVSAIPLGGYVKLTGMIDESLDVEAMKEESEPQPWEYRAKPAWQKAIIISAGVTMNFILAVFIFSTMLFYYGEEVYKTRVVGAVLEEGVGKQIGLQPLDEVIRIGNDELSSFSDIDALFLKHLDEDMVFTVLRNGEEIALHFDGGRMDPNNPVGLGLQPLIRAEVGGLVADYPAEKAGLLKGDLITHIDSTAINTWMEMSSVIFASAGKPILLTVQRGSEVLSVDLTPVEKSFDNGQGDSLTRGVIGIEPHLEVQMRRYGLFQALQQGFQQAVTMGGLQIFGFKQLFTGKIAVKDNVMGPLGIAELAGKVVRRGLRDWLQLVAVLSVVLAIVNLLPVPGLDGGHLIIILTEGIRGKPLSIKAKVMAQQAGMILLLMLILFVTYNDILRLFK